MPAYASQHFVPVFYSKAWADEKGQVTRYFFDHGRVVRKQRGPRLIGCSDHLWTLTGGKTGEIRSIIERDFFGCVIDDLASRVLEQMRAGRLATLSGSDLVHWAHFLVSLQLRNPMVIRHTIASIARSHLNDDVVAEWKEPFDLAAAPALALAGVVADDRAADKFLGHAWSVKDLSGAPFPLLTSDWPLLAFRSIRGREHPSNYVLPLSPNLAFFAAATPLDAEFFEGMGINALVRLLNAAVTASFMNDVWAPDDRQSPYIERRMKQRGQMTEAMFFERTRL